MTFTWIYKFQVIKPGHEAFRYTPVFGMEIITE